MKVYNLLGLLLERPMHEAMAAISDGWRVKCRTGAVPKAECNIIMYIRSRLKKMAQKLRYLCYEKLDQILQIRYDKVSIYAVLINRDLSEI